MVLGPQCQAGTGGIFSSSTVPRRKIQTILPIESPTSLPTKSNFRPASITIPQTPGTVFFDAKKSSKPDGALNADTQLHELQQTLSGSSDSSVNATGGTPVTTVLEATTPGSGASKTPNLGSTTSSSDPQLRGLSGSASVHSNQGTGSVESFFQINNNLNSPKPKKPAAGSPFRFLWHVMDNAGVPMFFGKNDDDLDPSLRQAYSSHGYPRATTIETKPVRTTDQSKGATEGSAVIAQPQGPHKIPESELEGTDSWVKDNDQMP